MFKLFRLPSIASGLGALVLALGLTVEPAAAGILGVQITCGHGGYGGLVAAQPGNFVVGGTPTLVSAGSAYVVPAVQPGNFAVGGTPTLVSAGSAYVAPASFGISVTPAATYTYSSGATYYATPAPSSSGASAAAFIPPSHPAYAEFQSPAYSNLVAGLGNDPVAFMRFRDTLAGRAAALNLQNQPASAIKNDLLQNWPQILQQILGVVGAVVPGGTAATQIVNLIDSIVGGVTAGGGPPVQPGRPPGTPPTPPGTTPATAPPGTTPATPVGPVSGASGAQTIYVIIKKEDGTSKGESGPTAAPTSIPDQLVAINKKLDDIASRLEKVETKTSKMPATP